MKRIVLALLALLGLVAHGAPAQAAACGVGVAQVGLVSGVRVQGQAIAARSIPAAAIIQPGRIKRDCGPSLSREWPVIITPTVLFGPDRARE